MSPAPREPRVKPLPFDAAALQPFLSRDAVQWHHDVHEPRYVQALAEADAKLAALAAAPGPVDVAAWGELKRKAAFNAAGAYLHDLYWSVLGGDGRVPEGPLASRLARDFGSFEAWRRDFTATGLAALGWAVLCFDPHEDRLVNQLVDFHHHGAAWGAVPLLALDVWEHAYGRDHGAERARYVEGFLAHVDWSVVEARWGRLVAPLLARADG